MAFSSSRSFFSLLLFLQSLQTPRAVHHMKREPFAYVARRDEMEKPLVIKNLCDEIIYPGIVTQAGTGPDIGGFRLDTGEQRNLTTSADWQGRVWGRTNCSFNAQGTGPKNVGGLNGGGRACNTGDCGGIINCRGTVSHRALPTLSERGLIMLREKPPYPLPNLHLLPQAVRRSTTFHWLTATIYPSLSSPCTPNQAILHCRRSLPT